MALDKWFKENWVDISKPKKNGKFQPCGRRDASKGKYPVCRPESVAKKLTDAEIRSSIRRKRKNPSKNIKHAVTASGKRRK